MRRSLDLNADIGESFDVDAMGRDEALLGIVTSVNVACGFHAGSPTIMERFARLSREKGAALGAHPGFDDREGFGRRPVRMEPRDLEYLVAYQLGALQALAAFSGATVRHVKPHGALYNMAARDEAYAAAVARAVKTADAALILVGPPNSKMWRAAGRVAIAFAAEGFCDRRYLDDGSLMPRSRPEAVISDPKVAAAQARRMAGNGEVIAASGLKLKVEIDTLCVHGDGPRAVELALAVRNALEHDGIRLIPMHKCN